MGLLDSCVCIACEPGSPTLVFPVSRSQSFPNLRSRLHIAEDVYGSILTASVPLHFSSVRLIRRSLLCDAGLLSFTMSLPAGAFTTSIGGRLCTAIPRVTPAVNTSDFSTTSEAAAVVAAVAATTRAAEAFAIANSSTIQAVVGSSSSNVVVAAAAAVPTISQSSSISVALPTSTSSTTPTASQSTSSPDSTEAAVPSTASATDQVVVTPQTTLSTPTPNASPTTSSEHETKTPSAVVESDAHITQASTSQSIYSNQAVASTIGNYLATQAREGPTQSSTVAAAGTSSSHPVNIGSIMGGIVGGMAFVGILFFLWWRCIMRRKSRDSLLTPLNGSFDGRGQGEKYEFDGDSMGPTTLGKRLKAQCGGFCSRIRMDLVDFGSTVKAKFVRESDAPSVNMNRGNSQFLEPIQQHSRSNSAVTGGHETALTTRDRMADWWQRLIEDVNFNWRLRQKANEPLDHFAATRSMKEKDGQANQVSPSFSQFLVMKDHESRKASERHRRSQSTATLPQLGSLGLEFSAGSNPFADPFPNAQPTIPNIPKPPGAVTANPYDDPTPKLYSSDYISNVRRSRGLSQSTPKNAAPATRLRSSTSTKPVTTPRYPSIAAPSSRYPSTIRTSQDSYSISGRNAKGRSDPFDLDRPDLFQRPPPVPSQSQAEIASTSKAMMQPRIESVHAGKPRIVSNAETYSSSKYSSGVSAVFSEWGDPGPDLGPVAWKRPGAEDVSIWSNEATRGSSVSSGQGSQIITIGRAV
jgi:hypothetical protein